MKTVLVVDDDPVVQAISRVVLQRAGYQVVTADNGTEAMGLLATLRPDLILMDWIMPHRTGMATLEAIKADAALAHIPVIFTTAKSIAEDRAVATAAGAAGYLVKPFMSGELLATVITHIGTPGEAS